MKGLVRLRSTRGLKNVAILLRTRYVWKHIIIFSCIVCTVLTYLCKGNFISLKTLRIKMSPWWFVKSLCNVHIWLHKARSRAITCPDAPCWKCGHLGTASPELQSNEIEPSVKLSPTQCNRETQWTQQSWWANLKVRSAAPFSRAPWNFRIFS